MSRFFVELEVDNFICYAENLMHAEEQARNAYPDQKIKAVYSVTLLVDYD